MISLIPPYPSSSYTAGAKSRRVTGSSPANDPAKRLFDLTVSIVVTLFVLSWLIPVVSLAIVLTSPGPAFFMQLRTGRNGSHFRCFKLRTMTYNPQASFRQASKQDQRVTRLGRLLRRTSLDELPQIFNVLRGEMSLVGPRPHPVELDAQHWHTMPGYGDRYAIRPGITGLAQVCGCRGETSQQFQMRHRVRLDRFYIQKRSPWLDLKICWWTVTKLLQGDAKAH